MLDFITLPPRQVESTKDKLETQTLQESHEIKVPRDQQSAKKHERNFESTKQRAATTSICTSQQTSTSHPLHIFLH